MAAKPDPVTLCFHTRDAIHRDGSAFTFEVPRARIPSGARRVALASCEFPMVQWTVEEEWNRLYINEGIRLDSPEDRVLHLAARHRAASEPLQPVAVHLPLRLNRLIRCTRVGPRLKVLCEHPHGLFCTVTGQPLSAVFADGPRLVGAGDRLLSATDVTYVSPTEFAVLAGSGGGAKSLFLRTATIESPARLCEYLNDACRSILSTHGVRLHFRYLPDVDRIRLGATATVDSTVVRLMPSHLAARCGLSTAPQRLDGSDVAHVWPNEPTSLWDYVEMPPGFYAPCHRPMCTGPPLRFGDQLELAVNRLYFPLPKEVGERSPHLLIATDPHSRAFTVSIPPGRYTPSHLCRHLEHEMNRAGNDGATDARFQYSVTHLDDRFVFSCAERRGDHVVPAPFGLLFHHPASVDPGRFGFAAQPLGGSHTYTAPNPTRAAAPAGTRVTSNVLRVSELHSQKRLSIHACAPPPMVAVTLAGGEAEHGPKALRLRTHVNGMPYSHGYQAGDVVQIVPCGAPQTLLGHDAGVPPTSAKVPRECSCVVMEAIDDDPDVLWLHPPAVANLHDAGRCLQVIGELEPWNLCFAEGARPHTIPSHLLGFEPHAVQWAVDGSVKDLHGRRLPPFEAPHVHCFDHPDYVLLTFSEAGGGLLEHRFDGEAKAVFAKLSLYPLFREERMLPRDTSLAQGGASRFTLAFWNPDMRTPYCFHGSQFSFSLTFV